MCPYGFGDICCFLHISTGDFSKKKKKTLYVSKYSLFCSKLACMCWIWMFVSAEFSGPSLNVTTQAWLWGLFHLMLQCFSWLVSSDYRLYIIVDHNTTLGSGQAISEMDISKNMSGLRSKKKLCFFIIWLKFANSLKSTLCSNYKGSVGGPLTLLRPD